MYSAKMAFKNLTITIIPNLGSNSSTATSSPRVIALVNWENLGDFVLFTSVIRETRFNFPDAKLIVVAQKENRELAIDCPYVEKWIWIKAHKTPKLGMGHGVETDYWKRLVVTYFALLFYGKRKIDLLIGPDWLLVENSLQLTNNLLFSKGNRQKERLQLVAAENLKLFKDKSHQVTRMLSILELFGLQVKSDEIENWMPPVITTKNGDIKESQLIKPKRILISLGAGQARRNWPMENVEQLITSLKMSHPALQITLLGPKSMVTQETSRAFPDSGNLTNLIGKTDLSTVASLMQNSDLLVSNDSGLAHIAASVKLSCVIVSAHPLDGDPWHLHSPNRYHPWKTEHLVIQPKMLIGDCLGSCQATYPHCIKTISSAQVLEACNTMLTKKLP